MKVLKVYIEGALLSVVPLPEGIFTAGSGDESVLKLPYRGISARHAEIRNIGDAVSVRDLDSTNGVIVNSVRVSESALGPDDEVLLGTALLKVEDLQGSAEPAGRRGVDLLYRSCLEEFLETLACDAGFLLSRDGDGWSVLAQEGDIDRGVLSETLLDRASRGEGALTIDDPARHPSLAGIGSLRGIEGPWSIHYVPLRCGGDLIGMVCLSRRGRGGVLDAEVQRRAGTLSHLAGTLLHLDQMTGALQAEHLRVIRARLQSEEQVVDSLGGPEILGRSEALREVLEQIRSVAPTHYPVLLLGETGTGKELLARRIHQLSARSAGPLIPVNCAAIPETLLVAELFGIEAGVATGVRAREGRFQQAAGGTLFLDEIGDLPAQAQSALLRALEGREKEIVRVGGREIRKFDVRIVAAGSASLDALVESGAFRRDLYFRLATFPIKVPPLRERPGDIGRLALVFARQAAGEFHKKVDGLTVGTVRALESHSWPGNIRELQSAMVRAALRCSGRTIGVEDLPEPLGETPTEGRTLDPARLAGLDYERGKALFEASFFRAHLQAAEGNVSEVARRTGLARRHLYERLRNLGIQSAGRMGEKPDST